MKVKRKQFNARGSNCPICKKPFRNGCNHSVVQAKERIEQDYIKAVSNGS